MVIDWRMMLAQLRSSETPHSLRKIAIETGIPFGSLARWSGGRHKPKHAQGETLIAFWQRNTGKDRNELPQKFQ